MITFFLLFFLTAHQYCQAQFEFVQLFDTILNHSLEAVAANTTHSSTTAKMTDLAKLASPRDGYLAISVEELTFVSVLYRIDAKALPS